RSAAARPAAACRRRRACAAALRPARTASSDAELSVPGGARWCRRLDFARREVLRQRGAVALRAQPFPQLLRRRRVDLERALVGEDDPVGVARELDRREVVEHVLAHGVGGAVERFAVPRGVRLAELDVLAGAERDPGHLRGQALLAARAGVLATRGNEAVPAAE